MGECGVPGRETTVCSTDQNSLYIIASLLASIVKTVVTERNGSVVATRVLAAYNEVPRECSLPR